MTNIVIYIYINTCNVIYNNVYIMLVYIRRRQIIAANEKFGYQPLLEHVECCC